MKRVRWELEEMVAIVDLYYRDKCGSVNNITDELIVLSRKLNKRADILGIDHDEKYRNLNGMKMIFENVRFADTDGKEGMGNASNMIYDTINLYQNDYKKFMTILNYFNLHYS